MNGFIAFTKKELCESLRTYKLIILGIVFLLLGIMSPLTAKLMPELIGSFLPEGMTMSIAEPTAMDSWMQFFKNVPQIGLVVTVILFSAMISGELSRGTLVNVLTKGLCRSSVILAKFLAALLTFTAAYVLCFAACLGYTVLYWHDPVSLLPLAVFALWAFGILLIASLLLGGVLFRSGYGALLFTGGFTVCLFLLNFFPQVQKFSPLRLAADNVSLLSGELAASDFAIPFVICGLLLIVFLWAAVSLFNRKQI
ncbi:ABC transporter permease subunit [Anaerovorax odorimutans]|uniref:ABC transporter permease subunit n=1 Tax=Anaerovorax odorimutans TaxID=109327 RepID=A0ABT1RM98_9FIRM|nr:ABC transporter permease subunit [Anaerovorax odorimutans]MCQ4636297.1 ABC transporter permease subunit [Anaerovorax odorimutans]